jgi:isopenicillin N synthase-like dioxygenase
MDSIPLIDIAPLFNGPSEDRDRADREIAEAAAGVGFFGARGWPANLHSIRAHAWRYCVLPVDQNARQVPSFGFGRKATTVKLS